MENNEDYRIKRLQQAFKNGEIEEEDISEEDKKKLIDLYEKQNNDMKEKLKIKRDKIKRLLEK